MVVSEALIPQDGTLPTDGLLVGDFTSVMLPAIQTGLEGRSWDRRGRFRIPYHRPVRGINFELLVRNRSFAEKRTSDFSVDVVSAADDGLHSIASVDFAIEDFVPSLYRRSRAGRPLIGVIQVVNYDYDPSGLTPTRPRPEKEVEMGLFVDEDFRREHIATSLISTTRIILAQRGTRHLIIDSLEETALPFYRQRGGKLFYLNEGGPRRNPRAIIPTAPTPHYPYRFE